jgi:hypothetical protein
MEEENLLRLRTTINQKADNVDILNFMQIRRYVSKVILDLAVPSTVPSTSCEFSLYVSILTNAMPFGQILSSPTVNPGYIPN